MGDYSQCHIAVGNWVSEHFSYLFIELINAYLVLIVIVSFLNCCYTLHNTFMYISLLLDHWCVSYDFQTNKNIEKHSSE